jgi:hypothetical protein
VEKAANENNVDRPREELARFKEKLYKEWAF